MILPKDIMDNVSYYEYTTKSTSYEIYDIITLHFKQWWKKSKIIKTRRSKTIDKENTSVYTYTASPGVVDLLNQLDQQIMNTYDGTKMFEKIVEEKKE